MIYYRVPLCWDNKTRFRPIKSYPGYFATDGVWVGGELYTEKELKYRQAFGMIKRFERVEIPKNRIYWSFGCRFEMED